MEIQAQQQGSNFQDVGSGVGQLVQVVFVQFGTPRMKNHQSSVQKSVC